MLLVIFVGVFHPIIFISCFSYLPMDFFNNLYPIICQFPFTLLQPFLKQPPGSLYVVHSTWVRKLSSGAV